MSFRNNILNLNSTWLEMIAGSAWSSNFLVKNCNAKFLLKFLLNNFKVFELREQMSRWTSWEHEQPGLCTNKFSSQWIFKTSCNETTDSSHIKRRFIFVQTLQRKVLKIILHSLDYLSFASPIYVFFVLSKAPFLFEKIYEDPKVLN